MKYISSDTQWMRFENNTLRHVLFSFWDLEWRSFFCGTDEKWHWLSGNDQFSSIYSSGHLKFLSLYPLPWVAYDCYTISYWIKIHLLLWDQLWALVVWIGRGYKYFKICCNSVIFLKYFNDECMFVKNYLSLRSLCTEINDLSFAGDHQWYLHDERWNY